MSHILRTSVNDQQLEIQMGWDSLKKWFYLVVFHISENKKMAEPIYSNLDHATKDLKYYIEVCKKLGVSIPKAMIDGVIEDMKNNVINRDVEYTN